MRFTAAMSSARVPRTISCSTLISVSQETGDSLNQRPTLEGLSEVGADLLGKMCLSLSWNLINSISVGWSPVSGIVSQIPLN